MNIDNSLKGEQIQTSCLRCLAVKFTCSFDHSAIRSVLYSYCCTPYLWIPFFTLISTPRNYHIYLPEDWGFEWYSHSIACSSPQVYVALTCKIHKLSESSTLVSELIFIFDNLAHFLPIIYTLKCISFFSSIYCVSSGAKCVQNTETKEDISAYWITWVMKTDIRTDNASLAKRLQDEKNAKSIGLLWNFSLLVLCPTCLSQPLSTCTWQSSSNLTSFTMYGQFF